MGVGGAQGLDLVIGCRVSLACQGLAAPTGRNWEGLFTVNGVTFASHGASAAERVGVVRGGMRRRAPLAGSSATREGRWIGWEAPVICPESNDTPLPARQRRRRRRSPADWGCQISVVGRVQGRPVWAGKRLTKHIVRGLGGCGCWASPTLRGCALWYGLNRPSIASTASYTAIWTSRVVEEAHCAAMGGTGVYDRLYRDRIPIRYGVRLVRLTTIARGIR